MSFELTERDEDQEYFLEDDLTKALMWADVDMVNLESSGRFDYEEERVNDS